MQRRLFLSQLFCTAAGLTLATGCRSTRKAHVLTEEKADMVGTSGAGAETWKPLIEASVGKLLARHGSGHQSVAFEGPPQKMRICFVGVENKSAEEIGDWREQIYQQIDTSIENSHLYSPVSRRYVEAGLRQTRLRPDELMVPNNMRYFASEMETMGQPIGFLLFATISSGTTRDGHNEQRDYLLTLEMININTGDYDKESAELRKGYHKTTLAKWRTYGFR